MITVNGGSARQRAYVESIASFCLDKLLPRIKNIYINITLKQFSDNEGAYGYCSAEAEDERLDRPRHFEIEVGRNMRLRALLETVAHEMVHVKQYAQGELYESVKQGKHRWQGKWLPKDPEYWDRPWEIEAHGREVGLFVRWAEQNQLGAKSWTQDR